MKERPILFSGPMVRALLAGTKRQTRRVVKPQPEMRPIEQIGNMLGFKKRQGDGFWLWPNARERILSECPYGQPGDRLWVREAFSDVYGDGGDEQKRRESLMYGADGDTDPYLIGGRWTPSIHMPRWASRITLEITGVRVERLQSISEADAQAEGAPGYEEGIDAPPPDSEHEWSYIASFERLWESINGPGSWDANPWTWVVEFKRVQP